jgi:hypothetical protein
MDPTLRQQVSELRRSELLAEAGERRLASQFRQAGLWRLYVARLLLQWSASLSGESRAAASWAPEACSASVRCTHNRFAGQLVHSICPHDELVSLGVPVNASRCPIVA